MLHIFSPWNKVLEMLTIAFDESVMSKTKIYEWYKHFQKGCEHTTLDVPEHQRPIENMEKV